MLRERSYYIFYGGRLKTGSVELRDQGDEDALCQLWRGPSPSIVYFFVFFYVSFTFPFLNLSIN